MTGVCRSWVGWLVLLVAAPAVRAQMPGDLPRYDLHVTFDTTNHCAKLRERVTWTNRCARPATELTFSIFPLYKTPEKEVPLLAKTVEVLRATPSESLITESAGSLPTARLPDGRPLPVLQQPENVTAVVVPLLKPVAKGESVTVELEYEIKLPNKQGRWGHWQGVSFLVHWHPFLAVYDETGWHPPPFIPWHQPFFTEAGQYTATIRLPKGQVLAAPSAVLEERECEPGWRDVVLAPAVLRDFALIASDRFQVMESNSAGVQLRMVYLPEHADYARRLLRIASETMPVYCQWFGPYPYPQFTVCESYFPWNGNECAGLVMLDHRVFQMPTMGEPYADQLLSHEMAHQWWYNLVGTHGYAEPFMDEGPATYFAHRLMDRKHGKNNELIRFPRQLNWLPNIRRENYRYGTWYSAVRRNEAGPAAQAIDKYSHVYDLFSGAYDRGSRVFMMIEDRLGEAAFIDFVRTLIRKYSFRILRVSDFQRELEEYTGRSWEPFFREWVYGRGLSDWQVDDVKVKEGEGGTQVDVVLSQRREIDEATVLGFKLTGADGYAVRVPVSPLAPPLHLDEPHADVTPLGDHKVRVSVRLPGPPEQVTVDPDQVLPDADPTNNHWRPNIHWRLTPLYTQVDEADIVNDYDRWVVQAGPYVYASAAREPWYTRALLAGFRIGAVRSAEFAGGTFVAYRSDFRDFVVGADGYWDHLPFPKTQFGFHVEKRIGGPIGEDGPNDVARAVLWGRYVFSYTAATYLNPMKYVEVFGTYYDNANPFARNPTPGAIRPDHTSLAGVHYSLNYLTPYWDPEAGIRFDATYSGGTVDLDRERVTNRVDGQFTFVKTPPDWTGPIANTRLAVRFAGAAAWPNEGLYYGLGGSTLFRGFDLSEKQGSMFWLGNVEWRIPVVRHLDWDVCDHLAGLRGVYFAAFYDVGSIYAAGQQVGDVNHAIGAGLRWDIAWFSFLERSMLRLDVAKTVGQSTPIQVWVGVMHTY